MKRYYRSFLAVLSGIALLAGGLPSAWAQADESDEFVLEEVTVTAQKRSENQQKVAIAMDVISGEDLAGTGKTNVDDILRDLSNVLINKSPDGMRVTVRGLADEDSPWHDMHVSTPTVAVNIDGAYNSSSSAGQNLFDLERVEVLAGPQSTLYGSNSPGGIVNVVTASPKTDRFSTSASLEYGSYDLINANAMVNVPIVQDKLAMRLAAQHNERDSWVEGSDNSQDTTTARLKTLYKPTENFSANFTVSWSTSASGGQLGGDVKLFDYEDGYWGESEMGGVITRGDKVTNPWTSNSSGDEGGGDAGGPGGPGGETEDGSVSSGAPNAMGQDADTWNYQAEIVWDSPIGSLSVVPSYSEQKSSELRDDVEVNDSTSSTGYSYTTQYSENRTEQKGAEVRMASPSDFFFQWIVGGTYYESDRENVTDDYYIDGNDSYMNTKQKNKAVYGNLTYPITDSFRGTAGYRRSWDEASNVEIPAKVGDGNSGQDYSNPDYKLGIEYDLADSSMVYATYATSYRVNAMAVTSVTDEGSRSVPPEELKSYTIGAKNRFFDNKVQVNVSAYFYDYTNKQFAASEDGRFSGGDEVIESPDGGYGIDFNNDGDMLDTNLSADDDRLAANPDWTTELSGVDVSDPWTQQFGDFESYGVDLSADFIITSKDRLSLSLSYLHAKWTHATIEYYWGDIWETNGDVYDGRTNTYSPTWSGNASYQHNFMLGSLGSLVPQIDVSFQSGYNLSFATSVYPYNYQEDYYLLNGSLTFNHSSGIWSVNAYVKNATDYAVKNFWMNMSGTYSLGLNDPRTYGAVLSLKF